jgi:hypothetical protein
VAKCLMLLAASLARLPSATPPAMCRRPLNFEPSPSTDFPADDIDLDTLSLPMTSNVSFWLLLNGKSLSLFVQVLDVLAEAVEFGDGQQIEFPGTDVEVLRECAQVVGASPRDGEG